MASSDICGSSRPNSRGSFTDRVVLRLDIPTTSTTEQGVSASPLFLSDSGLPSPAESWDTTYPDSDCSTSPLDPYIGASPAKQSLEQIQRLFGGRARPASSWSTSSSDSSSSSSWYSFSPWKARSPPSPVMVTVTKAMPRCEESLPSDCTGNYLDGNCMPYGQDEYTDMGFGTEASCNDEQPTKQHKKEKRMKFMNSRSRGPAQGKISLLR